MNNFKATTVMVHYIKYVFLGVMLLFCLPGIAQQKQADLADTKNKFKRTTFSLKENIHHYNHEVLEDGLYDVMIISPDGSLQSKPVKQQTFVKDENIKFSVNSKYWKAGMYKIIVEKEDGKATVYQLKIASEIDPKKR